MGKKIKILIAFRIRKILNFFKKFESINLKYTRRIQKKYFMFIFHISYFRRYVCSKSKTLYHSFFGTNGFDLSL